MSFSNEVSESLMRMEAIKGGESTRIRVATYVWRIGRNGLRNVTDGDGNVLTSAVRTVSPPEIVILALCSPVKVTTGWKTQMFKSLMGSVTGYVEAACIERGGSFLSIHTLSSAVTPGRIIVGSFEANGRQNTVASISFGKTRICVCNWALPRRTREHQSRVKSIFDYLSKTYEVLGSPNIVSTSSHITSTQVKRRSDSSSNFASVYQSILEKGSLLLASHEHILLTGGFESRTTDGKDQLAQAMKKNQCLPGFYDADAKGSCVTSYYDPTQPGMRAMLRLDIPKGRTARIFTHTAATESPIKIASMRVAPLDKVSDRPVAAVIELEIHKPASLRMCQPLRHLEDIIDREVKVRSAIIDEYTATVTAADYFKDLIQSYSSHVAERRSEQKRLNEQQDSEADDSTDSEDSGEDVDDCSPDVYIPPSFKPLGLELEVTHLESSSSDSDDQQQEKTLLEKLLHRPSDIAHELCFDTYYPPTPASTASITYVQSRKLLPRQREGGYPCDPSECSSDQVSSLSNRQPDHGGGSPSHYTSATAGGGLKPGAYSPTYYLPPAFTLLWSVSREAVAEGRLEYSSVEEIAAATLYNEEHWTMLYERGKLAANSKAHIREKVLRRREQQEMASLKQRPLITKSAKGLPSRGDFYGYTDEWKKRSEVERKLKEDNMVKKEEQQFKESIAKMSQNSAKIMSSKKNYKSPVSDWAHHAVDHFSRKHQEAGPGGVFEPVINQRSYDLGKVNRGTLEERNTRKRREVDRKLQLKREEFSDMINPETGKEFTFAPTLSENATKMNKRGFDAMYNGWRLSEKQKASQFKRKYDGLGKEECPFAPELDERSLKIMNSRPHVEVYDRQPSPSRAVKDLQSKKKYIRLSAKEMEKSAKRMSEAKEHHMKQEKKKKTILENMQENYSHKPEVNPKSTRLVKERLSALRREESQKPPPPAPNAISLGQPFEEETELPAYPAAARRGKTRSVSPNANLPRPLTSGMLIQRPRKGTFFDYGSPTRSQGDASVRYASNMRSASQEFYTPLRSSTSVPWLVPQDAIPVTVSDNGTGSGSFSRQGKPVRMQPPEFSPTQPIRPHESPLTSSHRNHNGDPYSEIEKHLYTMCGVLDDYRSLEDYASTLSAV